MQLAADDIAVGVFTSALNLRERALSVQRTWLADFPKGFLVGGCYEDPGLKMISLGPDVGEDYQSAHFKQFLGLLELFRRFPDAKWFYLTGCDAFVFSQNLVKLLSQYDPDGETLVGGHCGEVTVAGERILYPAGGPGFALSRALVRGLAPAIPSFVDEWMEIAPKELRPACDAAMAYLARESRGVRLSYAEGFYYGPPYYYPENTYKDGEGNDVNRDVVERPIAFHNLTIREMYMLSRGEWPRAPGLFAKGFDRLSRLAMRKLHTRTLVNCTAKALFG